MNKSSQILSILFVLVATTLWFVGSWWYYTCRIKNTCETKLTIATQAKKNKETIISPLKLPASIALDNGVSSLNVITANNSDTDGDGISDSNELRLKTDLNKKDSDNDGISDDIEIGLNIKQPLDTDNDGIIDALDDDDDNDGLTTQIEVKVGTSPLHEDTDNDGIDDLKEIGSNALKPLDTDNDGIINALDSDDDADGIKTETELLLGINPLLADSDSDGISDLDEIGKLIEKPLDTDKDGIIDALDTEENLDKDGDGLTDLLEKKLNSDPNNVDSDDDGINDNEELGDNESKPLDTDNDGIINILDPDDDNDKLDTRFESEIGTNPLSPDTDGDSLDDAKEVAGGTVGHLPDTDKDGKIDPVDSDDDNDGFSTLDEIRNGSNPFVNEKDAIKKTPITATKKAPNKSDLNQLTLKLIGDNSSKRFKNARLAVSKKTTSITIDLLTPETNDYLTQIIKWLQENKQNTISLIGHSDSFNSAQENLADGINLVMSLREILIQQGAPYQQIDVASRGSAEPLTEKNRQNEKSSNRRIEISPINL